MRKSENSESFFRVYAREFKACKNPYQIAVLTALCAYAKNHSRECYPSIEELAIRARMSKSSVMRALSSLYAAGVLESRKINRNSNLYRLKVNSRFDKPDRGQSSTPRAMHTASQTASNSESRNIRPILNSYSDVENLAKLFYRRDKVVLSAYEQSAIEESIGEIGLENTKIAIENLIKVQNATGSYNYASFQNFYKKMKFSDFKKENFNLRKFSGGKTYDPRKYQSDFD